MHPLSTDDLQLEAQCEQRETRRPASIPSPLIIAYASWAQCDDRIVTAAMNGANVIIWFSLTLQSEDGKPVFKGSLPPIECIARLSSRIRSSVLHVVSFGGWNAPLPDTTHTATEYMAAFSEWNIPLPEFGWHGFDGIDWDAEGHDDGTESKNHATLQHLKLIGEFSQLAKRGGYIVSMAPSQSYLDVHCSDFDLNLSHAPSWKSDFPYHGLNLYAYVLANYDRTDEGICTFDWIGLQIYEGYSRANDAIASRSIPFEEYVQSLVARMDQGWTIDFGVGFGGKKAVRVPAAKLVIGLANGWASPYPQAQKFLFVPVESVEKGWTTTAFAGFMFWTIAEEGNDVNGVPFYMAKELARITGHV